MAVPDAPVPVAGVQRTLEHLDAPGKPVADDEAVAREVGAVADLERMERGRADGRPAEGRRIDGDGGAVGRMVGQAAHVQRRQIQSGEPLAHLGGKTLQLVAPQHREAGVVPVRLARRQPVEQLQLREVRRLRTGKVQRPRVAPVRRRREEALLQAHLLAGGVEPVQAQRGAALAVGRGVARAVAGLDDDERRLLRQPDALAPGLAPLRVRRAQPGEAPARARVVTLADQAVAARAEVAGLPAGESRAVAGLEVAVAQPIGRQQ